MKSQQSRIELVTRPALQQQRPLRLQDHHPRLAGAQWRLLHVWGVEKCQVHQGQEYAELTVHQDTKDVEEEPKQVKIASIKTTPFSCSILF